MNHTETMQSGAHLVTQLLKEAGVTTIFSLSGNQIMPIYDACIDTGLRIVHTRHEAAAVYMADAWAQITGQLGVALVAGGPGFSNSFSALFSAKHAESPVLLISGDSPVSRDGQGAFQELDQLTMTRPIVKKGLKPITLDLIQENAIELIHSALTGRPGPVHLALPFDLLESKLPSSFKQFKTYTQPEKSAPINISVIEAHLNQASRPIILTGPSCNESRAKNILDKVRTVTSIPVISMESPRGLNDPMLGTFKEPLQQADLVLLIGKKVDFTLQFGKALPKNAAIIVIDPENSVLTDAKKKLGEKIVLTMQAESSATLNALTTFKSEKNYSQWFNEIEKNIKNRALIKNNNNNEETALLPKTVCQAIQNLIDNANDPILICDGGEFGQWAQAFCQAPTRIINGVSGAIGGSIPYAIAAKIARPDATVFTLMGDGTVGFHLAEFDTAVRENASFIAFIGNDNKWNAEYLIQLNNYGKNRLFACTLNPEARYENAAKALGGNGSFIKTKNELKQTLKEITNINKPNCINIQIKGEAAPIYKKLKE